MSSSHPTLFTSRGALLLAAALILTPAVASAQQPERDRVPEAAARGGDEGAQQRCVAGPDQTTGEPSAQGRERPTLQRRGGREGAAARGGRGGPPAGRGTQVGPPPQARERIRTQAGPPPQARERIPAQARERMGAGLRGEGAARSERGPRGGVRPGGAASSGKPCGSV